VTIPGAVSLTAAGISEFGDVTGSYTDASGVTKGFLILGNDVIKLSCPGTAATTALGVNDFGDLVGSYVDGNGNTDGMLAIPH
jgi:hypothetical protein